MVIGILKDLIKIDTRTSIYNETEAALYLKKICDQYNIDSKIFEPVKGKGSIIAHIPGRDKSKKELLLLSHLDTAEFDDLSKWKFHPCDAAEFKGRIFGRGAIDCKGLVSIWISILNDIAKNNLQPARGITFAAVADEESGGNCGLGYLIENNELIKNCKYVIGEGGGFPIKLGNTTYYTCQNAEKGSLSYKVAGHDMENSESMEVFVGNPLVNVFKGLCTNKLYNIELIKFLLKQSLLNNHHRKIDMDYLLKNSYCWKRTDQESILNIDCLPGTNENDIRVVLKNAGIDKYDIQLISSILPSYTNTSTNLYQTIVSETSKMFPKSRVIPHTTPGYSDNRFLRSMGKTVYGYFPLSLEEKLAGIHGYNEHISISALLASYKLMKNIVVKFCNVIQVKTC